MVEFDLWKDSFYFFLIFAGIVLIPSVVFAVLGRRMIKRISYYPSKMALIFISWEFILYVLAGMASLFFLYCAYMMLAN